MRKIQLFISVFVFALIISCDKKDCLKSSGEKVTEIRILEKFKNIEINNYFKVYLKIDTVNKIEIESGENMISNIETVVIDEVLTIRDKNACGFMKGYEDKNLFISVDTLESIVVNDGAELYSKDTLRSKGKLVVKFLSDIGTCDLTVDNTQTTLSVWYASGDFILHGKTNYLYIDVNELAFGYAQDLETASCYVISNSMGDCYVNTRGKLSLNILNSGNVYYKNTPSEIVYIEDSGSGELIKLDK